MPRIYTLCYYTWQITLGQKRSCQDQSMIFLNLKILVRLHRTLFLPFTNPVGILLILTLITIHSGAESLTNSPSGFLRPNLC